MTRFALTLLALCLAAAAAHPQTTAPDAGLVVVRVEGEPVTEGQLLEVIEDLARQQELTLEQRRQRHSLLFDDAIDSVVTITLLKREARDGKVTVEPSKVDEAMLELGKRYPSPEDFAAALEKQGVTKAELRANIEQSLAVQQVLEEVIRGASEATPAEIEKFYDDNPDKFALPERVHAAHILVRVGAGDTPEQQGAARKKLEALRAEIESGAVSFAAAAAEHSEDTVTAARGGDMGVFTRGQMPKPFEDAAFATLPGTVSAVVETPVGYHLIRTIERRPAGQASLEEARPAIKKHLDRAAQQEAARAFLAGLKAEARIESFMTREEFARRHPVE
ncbi:MAG: peptidylprolyl isomerase [Acidobacteriota bacterium]|jgi:peptidyl-prolyl cis-trans isomerase C|nr:peptidylprolyl isomerase [Acidobacteriota bacterium]NLT33327.1 hypothetical protein [Acidobacteriota bacterium]